MPQVAKAPWSGLDDASPVGLVAVADGRASFPVNFKNPSSNRDVPDTSCNLEL